MATLIDIDPQVELESQCYRAIVEMPEGSGSKFDYDPKTGPVTVTP